jgi:hypothetical protein
LVSVTVSPAEIFSPLAVSDVQVAMSSPVYVLAVVAIAFAAASAAAAVRKKHMSQASAAEQTAKNPKI